MNRSRAAPSRASATTLCQKCLKRGHYSYECITPAQSRPYVSRPSRTQQLLNPALRPGLDSDVPNDLVRKKGIADEQLARSAAEHGRRASPVNDGSSHRSNSSDSISTISTDKSRSASPPSRRSKQRQKDRSPVRNRPVREDNPKKSARERTRSSSVSSSESDSDGSHNVPEQSRNARPADHARRRSPSPHRDRVRQRSRSPTKRRFNGRSRSPVRKRSLSPYSRRLALTQAMNR